MNTATIKAGRLEAVRAALAKRGSWGIYIGEELREGVNYLTQEMLETLADVSAEVCGLEVR